MLGGSAPAWNHCSRTGWQRRSGYAELARSNAAGHVQMGAACARHRVFAAGCSGLDQALSQGRRGGATKAWDTLGSMKQCEGQCVATQACLGRSGLRRLCQRCTQRGGALPAAESSAREGAVLVQDVRAAGRWRDREVHVLSRLGEGGKGVLRHRARPTQPALFPTTLPHNTCTHERTHTKLPAVSHRQRPPLCTPTPLVTIRHCSAHAHAQAAGSFVPP